MTKLDFLYDLRAALKALPKEDVEHYIDYYSEMIDDRIEDGMNEADAVAEIGSVEEIAAKILGDTPQKEHTEEPPGSKRRLGGLEILLLVLGFPLWFPLLIAAFAVIVSLFASLYSVVISLWAVVASLCGTAAGSLVTGVVSLACGNLPAGLALLGAALFFAGLSVFAVLGGKAVTKSAVWLTAKTVIAVKKIFVRKEAAK